MIVEKAKSFYSNVGERLDKLLLKWASLSTPVGPGSPRIKIRRRIREKHMRKESQISRRDLQSVLQSQAGEPSPHTRDKRKLYRFLKRPAWIGSGLGGKISPRWALDLTKTLT